MKTAAETDRQFDLNDLQAVVAQIWSAYLDVDGTGGLTVVPESSARIPVTASVPMTGTFTGHVGVATSGTSARRVAALMLELETASVHDDDIIDAVGELANIIAGNVKALLPQPTTSGIPSVTLDGDPRFPGRPIQQLWGKWGRDTFYIGVLSTSR
jgi:chemotaxis protein CheX